MAFLTWAAVAAGIIFAARTTRAWLAMEKPAGDLSANPIPPGEQFADQNPGKEVDDSEPSDEEAPVPPPAPLPQPSIPPVKYDKDGSRQPKPVAFNFNPPDIPPTLPVRRLPPLPNVQDKNDLEIPEAKLISVKQDALDRTYGCMLHSPITQLPITFYQCKPPNIEDKDVDENGKKFFEWLARKAREGLVDEAVTGACVAAVNLLPIRGLKFVPGGGLALSFGCGILGNLAANYTSRSMNALQSIDGQGHINFEVVECSDDVKDDEDPTKGLVPANSNINECFVPIRNFKTNEPEQLGMRRQLQVIYSRWDAQTEKRYEKSITVPNPRNDLDAATIKSIFPSDLEFGETKLEADIMPFGHIRIYVNENGVDGGYGDSLIDGIVSTIIEGDEVDKSRRWSTRKRDIITGAFKLRKAFVFSWEQENGKPPLCKTITFDS